MTYCYPFWRVLCDVRCAVCDVRRPLTFGHFRLLLWKGWTNFNQIWYIATMGKGEHKLWISWSLPPWGLRGGAKTIQITAIFKNLLLYSWTSCSQTVCMIVISNKSSTKIVKFMAPGSGVLELEGFKGHILCTYGYSLLTLVITSPPRVLLGFWWNLSRMIPLWSSWS